MPCELLLIVIAFAPLFTKPVFHHVGVLIQGAILSPSSRTVASCLRVMGFSDCENFQNYHRVLNRSEWRRIRSGSNPSLTSGENAYLCRLG
jgi:hypothetical protein